jgi:hypothetical protein
MRKSVKLIYDEARLAGLTVVPGWGGKSGNERVYRFYGRAAVPPVVARAEWGGPIEVSRGGREARAFLRGFCEASGRGFAQ